MECQARVLGEWREPLIKASCLLGYISEALAFAEVAYDSAEVIIRDALRQLKQKMVLIDDPGTLFPTQTTPTSVPVRSCSGFSTVELLLLPLSTFLPRRSTTASCSKNSMKVSISVSPSSTTFFYRAFRIVSNGLTCF